MRREDINALAQQVNREKLYAFYNTVDANENIEILTPSTEQTLLLPVKDPISGGSFYAGEVLVTSCIVQVNDTKGWAMVMDSDEKLALYVAVMDACFAAGLYIDLLQQLLEEEAFLQAKQAQNLNQKVNATRVSFDLM